MMAGAGGRRNASMQRFSGCFVGKTWKHFRANLGVTAATLSGWGDQFLDGGDGTEKRSRKPAFKAKTAPPFPVFPFDVRGIPTFQLRAFLRFLAARF
jgi:hypothetical protein